MAFRAISKAANRPYVYIYANNAGSILSSFAIPSHLTGHEIVDDPVFLTTNKVGAYRWQWNGSSFVQQQLPVQYGTHEYMLMPAPNGTVYVYYVSDAGSFLVTTFTSGVPTNRLLSNTVMHKGSTVWVADNRFKPMRK
ncbi:MAG: hypothetical protein OEY86_00970 [Nitrospira sp.]|nr:hypothetical protein [Nitrospira sp.]